MLETTEPRGHGSIEVAVVVEDRRCREVGDIQKAELAPRGALLAYLGVRGQLVVQDVEDSGDPPAAAAGQYTDFCWEEPSSPCGSVDCSGPPTHFRLLAVGCQWDLELLEVKVEPDVSVSLQCVCEVSAERLLHPPWEEDPGGCELQSVRLLGFTAGRCLLLLNSDRLLQLQWQQKKEEEEDDEEEEEKEEESKEENFQMVSSCRIQMADSDTAVHHCVCRNTLFILRSNGLISVHDISHGRLLASVDLPSYFSPGPADDELTSSLSSSSSLLSSTFCLLQVSADLSTVVSITQSHTAVAVNLNHYFRVFPAHLLSSAPQSHSSMQTSWDRDSLSSSGGLAGLSAGSNTDCFWEARLTSMYNRAQNAPSPYQASSPPWWCSLPHLESSVAPSSAHSRVPPGGAATTFSVGESAVPSQLTVSSFSALLSFITPGNGQTTVSLWDMESQEVRHHRAEGAAAPVQRCGERQHRFLLRQTGVFQVLFGVTQQDLLSRLMLFGSAATVDAVCHLNSWGRCSIPIHSLQAGLKNRQLDTVDFYLKSKENILDPPTADPCAAVTTGDPTWPMDRVMELCPALDLLCSAIRDSHSESQSRQFSEQLLSITLNFINMQIRTMMSCSNYEDSGVHNAVGILDRYVIQLRSYMKRFPWPPVGDASNSSSPPEEAQPDEWDVLPMEEVVRQSILTNQIPRAQAVLQRRSLPEQLLTALRTEGLRQVFCCLQIRDLQTASTLLTNMGFSVKKQLHSICLYTDDKDLRELMVEELSHQNHLPKEEMQSVEFIREMEMLGSLPAFRCLTNASSQRVLELDCVEGLGEEILKQIIERGRLKNQEEEVGLWRNLRLDWVKNWDLSSRTAVSLSRRQHTELTSCEPSVLWHYLTSIHNKDQILAWIQNTGTSGVSQWPELSPELVDSNTACSTYMTECILDILARRDVFIPKEVADLEQLLWRLAQCGGLMALSTSIPHCRSELGLDFHSVFITFCLQHNLHYLLYTYLEHYRLTPRNCPLLSQQNLSETQPWFEMLVKIQEITRDLSDPELVFHASLTSAQVLLPGSQASLNSLLLEGHSQLALAAIMFAPGGLDQVMAQGKRSGQSEGAVDPQLLKMALATHPKLKATLFPSAPRGTSPPSDVSVYHLLQSLSPLDPSILFGWQAANTLNYTETSELPHFSSPHLVSKFALVETLDFLFYLRHGRPSFAYATFLVQQLGSCSDIKLLLQWAHQQVYKLTLQCFNLPSVTSAAVCFFELLGLCSLKLRVDIRAMNAILQHWNQQSTHTAPAVHLQRLVSKSVKLVEAELEAAEELIQYLEAAVMDTVEQKGFTRSSYEAAQEWVLPVQFCQLHGRCLSSVYPRHCAEDRQFIHFLLFVQLHNFPPQQVRSLVAQFDPSLQAHLSLAFQDLQVYSQTSNQDTEIQPRSPKNKSLSATTKPEHPGELFQVLLESQEEPRPWKYLLQEALIQCCPTLAVLAVCLQGAEVLQCLCVWVLTSIDKDTAVKAVTHLAVAPEYHEWTLHDLSIIWKTLLGLGRVRPLLQGFELFQKDCPLVLVLRMFELCCNHKNFTEAKLKLMDFQKTLIALRNSGAASETILPLQWVESQASVLVLTMLQRCSSHYDLHRLLQLLAGVDKLIKSNGPDFKKLSQLSQLLQGSNVSLSPQLLQCSSPSVQQEEFQGIIDMLHSRGLYSQARQVALLADLPVHCLLLRQLHQEVSSQKSRRHWGRLETRITFWKKCHEQLKADGSDPASASHFFLSQAESAAAALPTVSEPHAELLDLQEHSLLLSIAAHWLSLLSPAPIGQLESLEKELWMNQVRKLSLQAAVEKESVFNLPHDTGMYKVLMKDFSFSNISDLNREKCLSLEEVPGPNAESGLSPQDSSLLSGLIGQLLDSGSIHEASRVCRYFSLYHSDLWVVLRCRGLASGHLNPEPEKTAGPTDGSLSTSHSYSSLLSFVMLPEDEVAVQLQRLLDQCRHGKNYCKQVLGLYQLSKELQCSFSQISSKEPHLVLEMLLQSEQLERFKKAQVFIKAQSLGVDAIAQLVSSWIVQGLVSTSQEPQCVFSAEKLIFRPSEGRDSLMQLIKLCEDPNLVGVKLLENLNTVPLRDLRCIVELLIVAHDCFSLTCNMEGIVRVLQAARHLSHTYLSPGEHHSLLVRLLTGIGRYNEMTYVFDLLHQNHCFEMLLRKKVDSERGQNSSLKTALLDYIKHCLPADSEKHNMVALCFSMRREIGENHEMAARTQLKIIESQAWAVTPEVKSSLVKVLSLLKDAAESFSKDSCVRQASRCVRTAKLVTLQLHFINQGSELRIINLRPAELLSTVLALPRCYQVFVVSEAYSYSPDWPEILYQKVVLHGDFLYLEEFNSHRGLNSALFEDIFKKLDGASSSVAPNVKRLLSYCDDVYTRYRLAYQQNLHDVTKTLLQDSKTSNYLNDRLAS